MDIKALVSVIPLADGRFLPDFKLLVENDSLEHSYKLSAEAACDTAQEAMIHAKWHAEKEAKKQYGEDVVVVFM